MAKASELFKIEDFRDYLRARLEEAGRGAVSLWASKIKVHPSLISQVLQGGRTFTPEQAFDLAELLALSPLESEYFQKLVSLDRAGTPQFRTHVKKELEALRKKALNLSERFVHEKTLSETDQARFYSHRLYSAIRLFCSTSEEGVTWAEIEKQFRIERDRLVEILEFLKRTGLLVEEAGRFRMGTQRTFLSRNSPFLPQHHSNWRVGALARLPRLSEAEMMFTCPMSISEADFARLREMLAQLIEKSSPLIADSPAERVACLNLDLFWVSEE